MFSENASLNGTYFYLLPDRSIRMEVSAPEHKIWTYAQNLGGRLKISATDHRMQIELDTKQ